MIDSIRGLQRIIYIRVKGRVASRRDSSISLQEIGQQDLTALTLIILVFFKSWKKFVSCNYELINMGYL